MTISTDGRKSLSTRRRGLALGLLACFIGALYLLPLMHAGYPYTHDRDNYPLRVAGLSHAVAAGDWSGRWLCDFAKGFGYPLFNFYPPGFTWVAVLGDRAGLSAVDSAKAAAALFSLLGTLGVFCLARRFWRSAPAGFLAALVWTFFPYRILTLYVRGDLAELAALSLMPWALLGHWLLLRGGRRRAGAGLILAAAAHGAIFALHNISALVFQGLLLSFDGWFLLGLMARRGAWRVAGRLLAAHGLALALGATFWLPAFYEKQYVHIGALTWRNSVFDVRNQLLWLRQLFVTRWDWGSALPGPEDELSFQLGWSTLAGLGLGVTALAWRLRHRRRGLRRWAGARALGLAALAAGLIFLTLNPSLPFWEHVALARFVQFPWRLLGPAGLFLALLAGPAAWWVRGIPRRWRVGLTLLAAAAVPAVVWAYLTPAEWLDRPDAMLEKMIKTEWVTTAANNEYLPAFTPYFNEYRPGVLPGPAGALLVARGIGEVTGQDAPVNGLSRRFRVRLTTPSILVLTHFFYPGWSARIDGGERPLAPTANGLIWLAAPPGEHLVEFYFADTPLRLWAKLTTLAALGVLAYLALARWARRGPGPSSPLGWFGLEGCRRGPRRPTGDSGRGQS